MNVVYESKKNLIINLILKKNEFKIYKLIIKIYKLLLKFINYYLKWI